MRSKMVASSSSVFPLSGRRVSISLGSYEFCVPLTCPCVRLMDRSRGPTHPTALRLRPRPRTIGDGRARGRAECPAFTDHPDVLSFYYYCAIEAAGRCHCSEERFVFFFLFFLLFLGNLKRVLSETGQVAGRDLFFFDTVALRGSSPWRTENHPGERLRRLGIDRYPVKVVRQIKAERGT